LEPVHAALPPRTPTEQLVADVWAEVLGVPITNVEVPFTAYGGHSLLAMRVVSRLAQRAPVRLTIGAVFAAHTVAALAALIDARAAGGGAERLTPVPRRQGTGPLPLARAQEPIWLFEQMNPGTSTYHIPLVRRLRGRADASALRRALDAVVEAHPALRTSFTEREGVPVQEVQPHATLPWQEHDLRSRPAATREREGIGLIREAANAPFELALAPLARGCLVHLADDEALVAFVVHHLVADGASVGVIFADWQRAYADAVAGRIPAVPAPEVGLDDYAAWERATVTEADVDAAVAHWRTVLQGARAGIELPTDHPRTAARWGPAARAAAPLPAAATDAVRAIARAAETTPFVVLLAGFATLLHRYAGQETLVIGSPVARRERAELERLVGCLVSTVLLRAECGDDPSFATLVARLRAASADAFANAFVPADRLVRAMGDDTRGALFDVLFTLQDDAGRATVFGDVAAAGLPTEMGVAKFDLSLTIATREGAMRAIAEYRGDLFSAATIERMLAHLGTLLAAAGADPGAPLSRLAMLGDAERRLVVRDWNATARDYPPGETLVSLLEAQAAATPGAIAVADERRTMTYARLHAAADALARRLRTAGVRPGVRVGVLAERSVELVVALVATLKAGGAYVPFDPEYPRDRLVFMREDADVAVMLAPDALRDVVDPGRATAIARTKRSAARRNRRGERRAASRREYASRRGAPQGRRRARRVAPRARRTRIAAS
ncbi:MAG: AMP-binding protein, partial [Gemmatimonadetes bacterium]|nr:AMP-binding protein [Gemmatimonadota bacterium]